MTILWNKTRDGRPEPSRVVDTISPGGIQQKLVFKNNVWWHPDMNMYVYYEPESWRYV